MIPRVAKSGRSFVGAGKYYLHDKGAMTDDRVAFIETMNLPTDNPDIAIAHMVDTATHSSQLKKAAGIKGGRPLEKPVYCYSLAWHPSENPTQEDQLKAVQETLKNLGLADRQAIIIGHNDTDHRHVHVMVNRVCPNTGKAKTMSNDQLVLSDWAHEYRKARGELHFCPEREKNHAQRKDKFTKDDSMSRQEWQAWKKSQTKDIWDSFRADKAKQQLSRKSQYDALWRQKEERLAQRKAEVKAFFKPQWRDLFKRHRNELADFDAGLTMRIGFALGRSNRSKIIGVLQAITSDGDLRAEFIRKQEQERKQLGEQHRNHVASASREQRKAWEFDRNQLQAMHKAEDDLKYQQTKEKSATIWEERPQNLSGQDFDQTADRRKNPQERQDFEDKLRQAKGDEAVKAARDETRKRQRSRQRKGKDRKPSLD